MFADETKMDILQPMSRAPRIPIDAARIADFCRRHHIRKLALFGSVLRDDFRPDSDVDVLYAFEEGMAPGWDIIDVEEELSEIVGRKIDFVPAKYLNRWIAADVISSAHVIYDAEAEYVGR